MPLAKAATIPTRKRNRKRKRRAASSSSSSASSSSSSSEDESPQTFGFRVRLFIFILRFSESSSSVRSTSLQAAATTHALPKPKRRDSHSPSPPPTALPSFLPPSGTEGSHKREEELRARFRSFWMASVADGFRADLEELHKEPNLTESRLSLLIDSLASGADVFMSGPSGTSRGGLESISGINEMEVVLDGTT
ncbi:ribosome assembly protein [Rhizoctonia solani]|uniref:Ribosome assembly protein 3 n=1 Tax=Rhizoctonia solani TaxID=456999 RepID=A0A8H8NQ08_9AGAM|nr:ribosome assembly protein [Rhizoctonia solani]QRW16202.1 ribosome assembly protein [Rhizoctonia solani]